MQCTTGKCYLTASPIVIYLTKIIAFPSPLSAACVKKKLISTLPVNTENNNVVVNTILCRVRHQISATLE